VHVLQRGAEVSDIVNMAAIAVVDAQEVTARSFEDVLEAWQTRFAEALPAPAGQPEKPKKEAA